MSVQEAALALLKLSTVPQAPKRETKSPTPPIVVPKSVSSVVATPIDEKRSVASTGANCDPTEKLLLKLQGALVPIIQFIVHGALQVVKHPVWPSGAFRKQLLRDFFASVFAVQFFEFSDSALTLTPEETWISVAMQAIAVHVHQPDKLAALRTGKLAVDWHYIFTYCNRYNRWLAKYKRHIPHDIASLWCDISDSIQTMMHGAEIVEYKTPPMQACV